MSYQSWAKHYTSQIRSVQYKKYQGSWLREELQSEFYIRYRHHICKTDSKSFCKTEENLKAVLEAYENQTKILKKHCTMLVLINLAEPKWININCYEKLIHQVVCYSKNNNQVQFHSSMTNKTFICAKFAIYFKSTCFSFFKSTFQVNSTNIIYPKCTQEKLLFNGNNKRNAEKLFQIIIKAIGMGITFDYIKHKYVSFLVLKNEQYNWLQETFPKLSIYFVCQSNTFQQFISGEVVYKYGKACYISVMFMCEEIMKPTICNGESKGPMDATQRNICLTISLFYKSINKKLSPFSHQKMQEKKKHVQNIVLSNTQEMTLEKSKCDFDCQDTFQKCFTFKDLCIFRMNSYLQLVPCRTGTHLQVCGEFECNAHFKCPGYYCIPWGYLCNGKWDCPDGYDEVNCNYYSKCVDMFHCIGSQMCLHLQQICDKYIDCPFGDDEFLCKLKESPCLVGCNCHQYAILCNK